MLGALGGGSDPTQWDHANAVLEVSDVPRAIAYYRDVLGLVPGWMWEGRVGGVQPNTARSRSTFLDPIALRRRDLLSSSMTPKPATRSIRAAGAEIVDAPKTEARGLRGFTVRDPDGNLIGIAQEVHGPVAAASIGA